MITDLLVFLSATLSFWLAELFVLITARVYQVRKEIMRWPVLTEDRRRVLSLVLGLWFFVAFTMMQRVRATLAWILDQWVTSGGDMSIVLFHPFGVLGVLLLLWWIYRAVFTKWGSLIWLISFGLGLCVGSIALVLSYIF